MAYLTNQPVALFIACFFLMAFSAWLGTFLSRRVWPLDVDSRDTFGVIQAATLTLLGLIVGFSFSMALGRYDQRKNYEEAEANAIGTEYVRAKLLTASDAASLRALLSKYVDQRMLFYTVQDEARLQQIDAETVKLQDELWSSVQGPAVAQPNALTVFILEGMNDVLNSQGYTQAAWWNRIPVAAWSLMIAIATCANLLVGYGAKSSGGRPKLILVLPLIVAIAFLLIADIDSPRGGAIRVTPQNLMKLANSLRAR